MFWLQLTFLGDPVLTVLIEFDLPSPVGEKWQYDFEVVGSNSFSDISDAGRSLSKILDISCVEWQVSELWIIPLSNICFKAAPYVVNPSVNQWIVFNVSVRARDVQKREVAITQLFAVLETANEAIRFIGCNHEIHSHELPSAERFPNSPEFCFVSASHLQPMGGAVDQIAHHSECDTKRSPTNADPFQEVCVQEKDRPADQSKIERAKTPKRQIFPVESHRTSPSCAASLKLAAINGKQEHVLK